MSAVSSIRIHLHALLAAALVLAAVTMPRLAVAAFLALGAAGLATVLATARTKFHAVLRQPAVIALLGLVAYLFVNATWALDVAAALKKSGVVLAIAVAAIGATAYLAAADRKALAPASAAAAAALLIGIGVLLVEFAFGNPLGKLIYNNLSWLVERPSNDIFIEDGRVVGFEVYILNRHVTNAILLLWPALLLAAAAPRRLSAALQGGLAALAGSCAYLSASGTALAALGVGFLILGLSQISVRAVTRVVLVVWIVGVVFAVPLGALPAKLGWTSWTWLPETSVAARFYIWGYTAEKVMDRPIIGIGIRSTRELQVRDSGLAQERYRPRPGRHAHNAFLQVWLELGAIGAGLVLWLGIAALRQIGRLPAKEAAFGNALFVAACGVAAFGFGIWQTWLLSGLALSAVGFALAVRLAAAKVHD